jgi:hypothetical protein
LTRPSLLKSPGLELPLGIINVLGHKPFVYWELASFEEKAFQF